MNNLNFTLLFLFSITFSIAQNEFAPIGASWKTKGWVDTPDYINNCSETTCVGNFRQFISTDTITIDDRLCSIIEFYKGPSKDQLNYISSDIILYEEDNRIYFYYQDDFYLMLDFNLEVGDTLNFYAPGNYADYSITNYWNEDDPLMVFSGITVVEEVLEVEINGEYRKQLIYNNYFSETDSVSLFSSIEGIGNIGGFFGDAPFFIADGCHGNFICYSDSVFNYSLVEECDCEFPDIVSSIDELIVDDLIIYPNPTIGKIHLRTNSDFERVVIQDLNGRIVRDIEFTKELNLDDLEAGMYNLILESRSIITNYKVVKVNAP